MISFGIHEAKTHLSRLLKTVENGEEVLIKRGNDIIAKIVPFTENKAPKRPSVGTVTSDLITLSEDAFEPLKEEELSDWGL